MLLALTFALVGLAHAAPVLTDAQQAQAARIEQGLRCPVCSGESVYDSRAGISQTIREEVAAQVARGQTDTDIYAYFQRRFGDSILMQPPVRGVNLWLWGLPVAVVVAGGAWLLGFLKRRGREPEPDTDPALLARVDAELSARRGEG